MERPRTPTHKDFYIWLLECAETKRTAIMSRMADAQDWVSRARARVIEVLEDQHAVVHAEIESRISEAGWQRSGLNIDPHHVTTAVRELRDEGVVEWTSSSTRGGRAVSTLSLVDTTGRATAITRSAARKRLLFTRYLSWAQGTKRYPEGLIGPAGETATRAGILESGVVLPATPGAGPVSRILNVKLNGPLDSGGYVIPLVQGIPQAPVTVLIEVKSVRSWIYPTSSEPYQLLSKGVHLQRAQPDAPIVPILVCRRAHATTFWLAKRLGFLIIEMGRQFVGEVEEDQMIEVRNGLQFNDLALGSGPSLRVRDRLRTVVLPQAADFAQLWKNAAATRAGDLIVAAHKAKKDTARHPLVAELQTQADKHHRSPSTPTVPDPPF